VKGAVGFGVFSVGEGGPRVGFRVGEGILDLAAAGLGSVFEASSLNAFLALGRTSWEDTVARVDELVTAGTELVPLQSATSLLPFQVADYVDFYSSLEHATNLGRLFRPDAEPLLPNWRHLPVGYHGDVQVLKGFADLSPARQAAVCQAWAEAVRSRGGEVAEVRIASEVHERLVAWRARFGLVIDNALNFLNNPDGIQGHNFATQIAHVEERQQVLAQRGDLLLLAAQVDQLAVGAPRQEEDPFPRRSFRSGPEDLGVGEVEGIGHRHDGTSEVASPVVLTVRTIGPPSP
jgi:hypothetical protein